MELRRVLSVPLSISEEYLWIDAIVGHTECLGSWPTNDLKATIHMVHLSLRANFVGFVSG